MADRRMENVQEVIDWIKRLHNEGEGKHQDLADIVAHMSLMDILERNKEDDDDDAADGPFLDDDDDDDDNIADIIPVRGDDKEDT